MSYLFPGQLAYDPKDYPLRYNKMPDPQESKDAANTVQVQPEQTEKESKLAKLNLDKKSSSVPIGLAGAGIGLIAGGIKGAKNASGMIDGNNVNNKFAVQVYERYLKKFPDKGKTAYEECNNVLKKIESVKSPDELKALFDANPTAAEEACSALNKTPEEFLENVGKLNLRHNKRSIKNKLNAANDMRIRDIKNEISNLWNSEKKKFEKPQSGEKDLYRIVKRTAGDVKGKVVGKAILIGTAIGGAAAFLAHKLFLLIKTKKNKDLVV